MARTANVKLDTASARKRLAPRSKPYSMTIAPRRMLGYVRANGGAAGRWLSIVEIGRGPTGSALRRQGDLGLADDLARADGDGILSFSMALAAAAGWQPAEAPRGTKLTVRRAFESYVAAQRSADGDAAAEDARARLWRHVLREDKEGNPLSGPKGLGDRPVATLTLTELRAWRDDLVSREEDPVSRSTANRIIANVKAAFNRVFADEKSGITSDAAWRRLESFKGADKSREDHFEETDVVRLIAEARKQDEAFADLLEAGFFTGARLPGELAALDVRHFDAHHAQLKIIEGKTGPRVTTLTEEGVQFFKKLTRGKDPSDILLPRADGERWGKSQQHRPMKAALKAAKLPMSASVYSIRHTYVSRSIENGMPLFLIGQNIGTSVAMISKHYAHILRRVQRELIERTAPRLRVVVAKVAA
jgi:integrase